MFALPNAQFIAQNLHFGIHLLATLAAVSASWLYFDAWSERHQRSSLIKTLGFILLAGGFLITGVTWNTPGLLDIIAGILKLLGYLFITVGHALEPIQPKPQHLTGYVRSVAFAPATLTTGLQIALPLAAGATAISYWRRGWAGLEHHLRPLAFTFGLFTLYESLAFIVASWQYGSNPWLQQAAAPLGLLWLSSHLTLLIGSLLLSRWVWHYLTKRVLSQLFLAITSLTFALILGTTISSLGLLVASVQHDSLTTLQTATKVLAYAIDSKISDTRANAVILAHDPDITQATTTLNHGQLSPVITRFMIENRLSEAIITDDSGVVLARASDSEHFGDSLSNSSLVQRALTGSTVSGLTSKSSVLAPTLVMSTASPIRSGSQTIGVALVSLELDNAFVDGIKHTTNLDSTIYSGDTRAATTLTGPDGTSRSIGNHETNPAVITTTLKHGQIWSGSTTLDNQTFLGVYLPLKDVDNLTIGMLFVGRPQDVILQSASQAVKVIFITSAIWLIIIIVPIYLIARLITREVH